jgi:hypothetical protein
MKMSSKVCIKLDKSVTNLRNFVTNLVDICDNLVSNIVDIWDETACSFRKNSCKSYLNCQLKPDINPTKDEY